MDNTVEHGMMLDEYRRHMKSTKLWRSLRRDRPDMAAAVDYLKETSEFEFYRNEAGVSAAEFSRQIQIGMGMMYMVLSQETIWTLCGENRSHWLMLVVGFADFTIEHDVPANQIIDPAPFLLTSIICEMADIFAPYRPLPWAIGMVNELPIDEELRDALNEEMHDYYDGPQTARFN